MEAYEQKNLFHRTCSAKRSSTADAKIAESRGHSITSNNILWNGRRETAEIKLRGSNSIVKQGQHEGTTGLW
jgi:hypothetical protein